MLSGQPTRRGTIRSIKSAFGVGQDFSKISHFEESPRVTAGLNTLYLPSSIPSLKFMSPALWNWVTTGEEGQKLDLPRVFSPAGECLDEVLPKCLTSHLHPLPTKERPLFPPTQSAVHKQTRNEVVCLVGVEDQRRCTSILSPSNYHIIPKGSLATVECLEGFLLYQKLTSEIPRHKTQIVLSVRLYTKTLDMSAAPSTTSLSSKKSFFNLRRSNTISKDFVKFPKREQVPADPSDLGVFLGEYSMTIPCNHAFSKVDVPYTLTASNKEIGKVMVSMGLFFDTIYNPMPVLKPNQDIPKDMQSTSNSLNFYLLTSGGLIWDKKWVVASTAGLSVYSSEYQDVAEREYMAAPDCMVITIALPWKNDARLFFPTPLSCSWKDMVAEAGVPKKDCIEIYVSADCDDGMRRWMSFLDYHIKRNHLNI